MKTAKNKKTKCEECDSDILIIDPAPVADDMMDFIIEQEHWSKYQGPSICWGMVSAVFRVVFDIAPNEKQAVQLITDCMAEFMDGKGADA